MAVVQYKGVADGQLPSSSGQLAVPGSATKQWAGVRIYLHNTNAADQTVVIQYSRDGGTNKRIIRRFTLQQNQSAEVALPHCNGTSQAIYGYSTNASAVDYSIEAIEADTE